MRALDASAVARLLVELGRRTAVAGTDYFRSKAYLRAAESLAALAEPLDRVIAETVCGQFPASARRSRISSPSCTAPAPDPVLRQFDFVIGSIHGQFRLDRAAQTARLVRAAANP